ncbi:D-alanyl-D-alanine carboxypeptidase family protein [Kineococcus gynurae]|uniref:D-alanyl-D-alanine carboxypeptidase family protein n=1 Tax=Kineococcus gynurae TaxID=452979 RepID=A0ABV5LR05_9ACTN
MQPSTRPHRRLRSALLATSAVVGTAGLSLGLALGGAVVGPVAAASAAPLTAPLTAPSAFVAAPSPEEVEAARQAAAASRAAADAAQAQLTGAEAQLDALAAQANAALERYQQAVEARQAAETEEATQQERLRVAEETLARGKVEMGQWASQAYRGGGTLQEYSGLVSVLQEGNTDDAASALASVKRIGDGRTNAVNEYEQAKIVQVDATERAAAAATEARTQAEAATAAKQESDRLVAEQRTQVAALAALQASAAAGADADSQKASQLAAERAAELARLAAQSRSSVGISGGVTGTVGDCKGSSTSGYPNGMIPRSALCPLYGTSSHVLRADAANAFNQLSQAYQQQFGRPLCVTDSYRTLAEQIDVKKRKPSLAATPGTSRHGLGIAVDLGCGVQSYGSAQFLWMKRNSAVFGWIHPSWADQGGKGPFEPWHWEYSG